MRIVEINSNKNELFKEITKLKQKKYRLRAAQFLIEGVKFVRHAIEQDEKIHHVLICKALINESAHEELLRIIPDDVQLIYLAKDLFEDLSDTVNSQGVLAVASIPHGFSTLEEGGLYLALDQIQDPGNLGTIIRTADAAGFTGLIYSKGTVDPYGEKVLRSTMGSIFSLPLMHSECLAEQLSMAKQNGFQVLCTSLEDSSDYSEVDYKKGSVIVIGNESQGVSDEVFAEATNRIKIPIYGQAESLNAAVAAAIIMYEAVKQRR